MANLQILGTDLDLGFAVDEEARIFADPYTHVDLIAAERENVSPRARDLRPVSGLRNLVQALILRLMTERGELAALGHPEYGSRHHALIGEPNTENSRNLIKLYVLECLKQEPRLEKVLSIDVKPGEGLRNRDKAMITAVVKAKDVAGPFLLVVPFHFQGVSA